MEYYETHFEVFTKTDINSKNFCEIVSSGINACMLKTPFLKDLHTSKKSGKGYCFYSKTWLPIKKLTKFELVLRCYGDELHKNLVNAIIQSGNDYLFFQNILDDRKIEYSPLYKIIAMSSIRPVVIMPKAGESFYETDIFEAINGNLTKKYCETTGEIIKNHHPIKRIKKMNENSLSSSYKGGSICGNKYLVEFNTDDLSQKMAFLAMAFGLGSKNSLGFGAMNADNDYIYKF